MTTTTKKTTRRKSYKNMSVSELVKERSDLSTKIEEIDSILSEAISIIKPMIRPQSNNSYNNLYANNDSLFNEQSVTPVDSNPPIISNNIDPNNHMSPFSVFDAEAHARQQANEYVQQPLDNDQLNIGFPLEENTSVYPVSEDDINKEINELKSQLSQQLNS